MTRESAAGRGPGGKRSTPSRTQRSRAGSPTRRERVETAGPSGRKAQTTLTARAAILVLALASVIVAVAVPFKIWLGQRNNIASLTAQTRQTELTLGRLSAQDKQWQQPGYVESQARERLHYVLPGQKTYIVLGHSSHSGQTSAARHRVADTSGPWYSQFWHSLQAAGNPPTTKSGHSE